MLADVLEMTSEPLPALKRTELTEVLRKLPARMTAPWLLRVSWRVAVPMSTLPNCSEVPASAVTNALAESVTVPLTALSPAMLRSAPAEVRPVPAMVMPSGVSMPPASARTPPEETVVPVPVPPNALLFEATNVEPDSTVVAPEYVLLPDSTTVPAPETVAAPAPEMAPLTNNVPPDVADNVVFVPMTTDPACVAVPAPIVVLIVRDAVLVPATMLRPRSFCTAAPKLNPAASAAATLPTTTALLALPKTELLPLPTAVAISMVPSFTVVTPV